MTSQRLASTIAGLAMLAAACGEDASTVETGASCDADAAFATGNVAPVCEALDPGADPTEFAVDQIAPTETEDVLSGLDDAQQDGLPEPLIDPSRILSGGPPPDGIPSIDDPVFQTAAAVDWLSPAEAVVALEVDGEARAYPVQILMWHELVNDTIGTTPVTVSYCPLCNSALAYDRRLDDRILDFGTSGRLFNSSLVMYDRQTESLWTHFDGRAVAGVLTGTDLDTFPISTVSWEDFRAAHPESLVLTRNTGFTRDYGQNPYEGYDNASTRPFLFDGEIDDRLEPKTRVVVVRDESGPAVVLPLATLLAEGVVEFEAHGRSLVAVLDPGTASPLHRSELAAGYDQGAVGVFENTLDGAPLALAREDAGFVDKESGTTFDVLGNPDRDDTPELTAVEHLDTFWFAIAAFDGDVEIL